jgi:hypothetical protein
VSDDGEAIIPGGLLEDLVHNCTLAEYVDGLSSHLEVGGWNLCKEIDGPTWGVGVWVTLEGLSCQV